MYSKICLLLIASGIFSSFLCHSQTYEICHWLNDRQSATVLTFDDYSPAHWQIGIPALERENLPGTFFVTIQNIWNNSHYTLMNDAIANGIEIGFHTETHPHLPQLNASELHQELVTSKLSFDANLSTPSLTLAYPFGEYNSTVIEKTKEEHIAARTVFLPPGGQWAYEFANEPDDYFKIPTRAVNASLSLQSYKSEVQSGIATGGMVVFMYHSIYNDNGDGDTWFDAIHEDDYNDQLDYLQTVKDQTWVTTFSNAVRYHKEQHCATLTTLSSTPESLLLELTDTLSNNSIYNQELTIKLSVGPFERYTAMTQAGTPISYSLSEDESYYLLNAIPDGGEIELTKDQTMSVYPSNSEDSRIQVFPSPCASTFTIKSDELIEGVQLIDSRGFLLKSFKQEEMYDISSLPPGLYYLIASTQVGNNYQSTIIKQ